MGPLGWQETVFLFILALLLFGPKKLPELGKTLGKAITEFRRASNELKATFDREMKTLEQENDSLKEVTNQYNPDTYNYDYSSYDYGTDYSSSYAGSESNESTAANTPTESASATQGAESTSAEAPEGTIAHGTDGAGEAVPEGAGEPAHAETTEQYKA
jgi:TatA/E family protein of Tat protein translocase